MLNQDPSSKTSVLLSLKKARSQLDKVVEMVEADHYCIHIIQQTRAVRGLIKSAEKRILESHLRTCFKEGVGQKSKATADNMVEEIIKVTSQF